MFKEFVGEWKLPFHEVLKLKTLISKGADTFMEKEYAYIDSIFRGGEIDTISVAQLKNFLNDRANRKLEELGMLVVKYPVDEALLREMDWFYVMVSGEQQTDFFQNRETGYSKPNEDWQHGDIFD